MSKDLINKILAERGKDYGHFPDMCERFHTFSHILMDSIETHIAPWQDKSSEEPIVILFVSMIAVKLARLANSNKKDTIDDIHGYCRLAIQHLSADMIESLTPALRELTFSQSATQYAFVWNKLWECWCVEIKHYS